ncbi:MAG TPA: hypothetical protein DC047_08320 [Blastocatellia bacterium]|nr:hypothetical protein [Blastocatellia bacterium]
MFARQLKQRQLSPWSCEPETNDLGVFKSRIEVAKVDDARGQMNYAVSVGTKEASIVRDQTRAWSTVEKDDGLACCIAALLVVEFMNGVELMNRRNLQTPRVEGLNLSVQSSKFAHRGPLQLWRWRSVMSILVGAAPRAKCSQDLGLFRL